MNMDKVICSCRNVRVKDIKASVDKGADSVFDIQFETQAGSGCGYCAEHFANVSNAFLEEKKADSTDGL